MFPLGNNFFTVLLRPLSCGGPGQLPSLPSLKSGPGHDASRGPSAIAELLVLWLPKIGPNRYT